MSLKTLGEDFFMKLTIKFKSENISIELDNMIYHLASIKITGKPDSKEKITDWLSQILSERLGDFNGSAEQLLEYANEEILKILCDDELIKKYYTFLDSAIAVN